MNLSKNALSEKIFESLRDRIVHMEYPPGTALSEKDLCEEFGVSRTPLREAIRRLEDMKLVNALPRYGTYVTPLDIHEIRCAFEVKIKLEGLSGALAAKRITPDKLDAIQKLIESAEAIPEEDGSRKIIPVDAGFHDIVREAADNDILKDFLENLHSRCARLWGSTLNETISKTEVLDQLKEIYRALKNGEAEKAAGLLEDHVQYFIDKIKMQLL